VSYVRKSDRNLVTSQWRRVTVPASAPNFVVPAGHEIAARVIAKPAPRLLPTGATFAAVAANAKSGALASAYGALLARADKYAAQPAPAEPAAFVGSTGTAAWKKWKSQVAALVTTEQAIIDTLGVAWRLSGESRYLSAGKRHYSALASWSPTGSTGHAMVDLSNAVLAKALARGMDLFGSEVDVDVNLAAAASLRGRIAPIVADFTDLDAAPYDSHLIEVVQIATEALLLSAGHSAFPESVQWLATSWDLAARTMAVWGDDHGSWGNGVSYGWRALEVASALLAVSTLSTGFDMARQPWAYRVGDFLMAMTAPGSPAFAAMGDGMEKEPHYARYAPGAFRLYAALTRKPDHTWYWQAAAGGDNAVDPLLFLVHGLPQPQPLAVAPSQPSALFHDAGVVAMHDYAAAAANRSTVYFRSSRFGSFNHSHADQNAFSYVSRGQNLLVSGGYYPWYLSNHHATVGRATRYKNALTFDGGIGQAEPEAEPTTPGKPMLSMDARGELVNFAVSGDWTVTTGDATLAYRGWDSSVKAWQPLLDNALRTVAYNRKERVVVVYDWATSAKSRQWELNFNALGPFATQADGVKVAYNGAAACISVHGLAGSYRMTTGFDVAPEFPRPQQYQARYVAGVSSPELAAVTVIRDDCQAVPVSVQIVGSMASVAVGSGATLTFDRRTVQLATTRN
jgi:hypothetical protein